MQETSRLNRPLCSAESDNHLNHESACGTNRPERKNPEQGILNPRWTRRCITNLGDGKGAIPLTLLRNGYMTSAIDSCVIVSICG